MHIGDTTATAVLATGVRRVGLLGTGFTMAQPFYADRLAAHGLDVLVPSAEDQATVHRVIYDGCSASSVTESRVAYRDVIRRLVDSGAEGVIYGCTEIELLVGPRRQPRSRLPDDAVARRSCGRAGAGLIWRVRGDPAGVR